VDFILANATVFYMHWTIKDNLTVFNLADFHNLSNHQNKFYTKFSSYTVFTFKRMKLVYIVQILSHHNKHSIACDHTIRGDYNSVDESHIIT